MRISRFFLFMLLLLSVVSAQADRLYKWVDKDGRVSYHDRPPSDDAVGVEEKEMGARRRAAGKEDGPRAAVVLFSASQCTSCDLAREYLKKRNVPFADKDAEKDLAAQKELKERTGSVSVPTILVGEKVMRGYLESLLEGELDAAGYSRPEAQGETQKKETAAGSPASAETGLAPTR